MKKILIVFLGLIIVNPTQLIAGDKEDIIKQLLANNAYAKKIIRLLMNTQKKELWSSGLVADYCKKLNQEEDRTNMIT